MTTAISTLDTNQIAAWNNDEIAAAKAFLNCPTATDAQWQELVIMARTYHLNPLTKEVWILPKVGVFVGLAGMIKTACASGQFDGIKADSYNADGTLFVKDAEHPYPAYAECIVWRKDCSHEFFQRVAWQEFCKLGMYGKQSQWDKMPSYMLEKVAKSHALKLAFDLRMYIPEEFGVADVTDDAYGKTIADVTPQIVKDAEVEDVEKQYKAEAFIPRRERSNQAKILPDIIKDGSQQYKDIIEVMNAQGIQSILADCRTDNGDIDAAILRTKYNAFIKLNGKTDLLTGII